MVTNIVESKLLKNLKNSVVSSKNQDEDILKPNLEYDKIKNLYMSFDSGKLTSTLINLDIEELCFCLSCALLKYIEFNNNNDLDESSIQTLKKKN